MELKQGNLESKLMSMEMDFLRRSARCSRLKQIINNVIREKMNITNSVLNYIRYKQLNWCGHVKTMDEESYLEKFWNGVHLENKKKDLENHGCRK